ncbi:MAG: hypothetical protein NDJ94_18510 [Vicinamibacteria bacterium]|nr:hypothetical protein [Vicinamibacteria bacterium]
MKTHLRVARPFLVVLLLFAVGRLVQGSSGVPYERAHHVFSLVTLTLIGAAFHGAFARRWLGYGAMQALTLGAVLGLANQLVIFACTLGSLLLGAHTYFTHPIALNTLELGWVTDLLARAPAGSTIAEFRSLVDTTLAEKSGDLTLATTLGRRAAGLFFGSLLGALSAGIGWALGALLPADPRKD